MQEHVPIITPVVLVEKHSNFLSFAGFVAGLINDREFEKAKVHIDSNSQYSFASTSVRIAIVRLKVAVANWELSGHWPDFAGDNLDVS